MTRWPPYLILLWSLTEGPSQKWPQEIPIDCSPCLSFPQGPRAAVCVILFPIVEWPDPQSKTQVICAQPHLAHIDCF